MEGIERDHHLFCGMMGPVRVNIIVLTVSLEEIPFMLKLVVMAALKVLELT